MGYSRSAHAALRFQRLLDDMIEAGGKHEVIWDAPDPDKLSRQLREAMAGAATHVSEMPNPEYANLFKNYKVCIKDGAVIAKPRVSTEIVAVKRKVKKSYEYATTSEQVAETCITEKYVDELLFRSFIRSEKELQKLEKWVSTVEYKLIDHGVGMGVTIVRKL